MKSLKSFLLPAALGVALIAPVAVFAQQDGQAPAPGTFSQGQWQGSRQGGHHGFMRVLQGVDLSDSQRAQIKQIVQNFRQSHPEDGTTDPQARRQAREQLMKQIMGVLTPQQRTQVQQNLQQMRQRWQQRQQNEGDGQPQ